MTTEAAACWSLAALCLAVAVSECWTIGRPLRFCLGMTVGLLGAGLLIGLGDATAENVGRRGEGPELFLMGVLAAAFWLTDIWSGLLRRPGRQRSAAQRGNGHRAAIGPCNDEEPGTAGAPRLRCGGVR